ncbi:MAG: LuxR C-terminal-related transcriptional regulator [Chloroflexota bacterium]|nr:LuxR C-terminal-related transcriptional regulator [Chloroflexota bacterium]
MPVVDLWAPVSFDDLPVALLRAAERSDWETVKAELRTVMDGVRTDGVYGRALLQFFMSLPLASDPVLARYRAAICMDHGDWDGFLRHLGSNPIEAAELIGVRDIILASADRTEPPHADAEHHRLLFEIYEFVFQRAVRRYKRWAHRILAFYPGIVWNRPDISPGRHFRVRRLQDGVWLAVAESHGGNLAIAEACADEAQRLGDEGEPGRDVAHDLKTLVGYARGGQLDRDLRLRARISSPVGLSPLGSWETLFILVPFFSYLPDGSLRWTAQVGQQIARRLGSPRAQLQARSWHVAAGMQEGQDADEAGLPGLLAEARGAAPGLRVVPLLLRGIASRRPEDLKAAEVVARQVGNVWAQVSALTWLVALDPQPVTVRWLHRLLETTGWRRPIFVPPTVAADAALGLAAAGRRGVSIVEVAALGERANVTVEVAMRHIDDAEAPKEARLAAIDALGKLGTTHSREILHRVSRRTDEIGIAARRIVASRTAGTTLSERELEVLDLARHGLTNRDIGERLSLSPHTIARHVANARAKLGAANRAEAAAKFEEMKV